MALYVKNFTGSRLLSLSLHPQKYCVDYMSQFRVYIEGRYIKYNGRLVPVKIRNIPSKNRPLVVFDGDPRQAEHLAVLAGYWRQWKGRNLKRKKRVDSFMERVEAEKLKLKFTPPTLVLKDGSEVIKNESRAGWDITGSVSAVPAAAGVSDVCPQPPVLLSSRKDIESKRRRNLRIYKQLQNDPRLRDFTLEQVEDMFRSQQAAAADAEHAATDTTDKHLVDIPNPYEKERTKCILCATGIIPSYKNPKLLSQFVSPVTGHIFSQSVAGLCRWQYQKLIVEIKFARYLLLMPQRCRSKEYMRDPELCDPMHPKYKILG